MFKLQIMRGLHWDTVERDDSAGKLLDHVMRAHSGKMWRIVDGTDYVHASGYVAMIR